MKLDTFQRLELNERVELRRRADALERVWKQMIPEIQPPPKSVLDKWAAFDSRDFGKAIAAVLREFANKTEPSPAQTYRYAEAAMLASSRQRKAAEERERTAEAARNFTKNQ